MYGGGIWRINLIKKKAEACYFLLLRTLASSFVHAVVVLIWPRVADRCRSFLAAVKIYLLGLRKSVHCGEVTAPLWHRLDADHGQIAGAVIKSSIKVNPREITL